jgi:hypothetical protein
MIRKEETLMDLMYANDMIIVKLFNAIQKLKTHHQLLEVISLPFLAACIAFIVSCCIQTAYGGRSGVFHRSPPLHIGSSIDLDPNRVVSLVKFPDADDAEVKKRFRARIMVR